MPLNHVPKRPCLAAAFAMAILLAAPMANASESWFPDLIFPEAASVPGTNADRTVTGSIPRAARQTKQTDRSMPARKRMTGGDMPAEKEIQQ